MHCILYANNSALSRSWDKALFCDVVQVSGAGIPQAPQNLLWFSAPQAHRHGRGLPQSGQNRLSERLPHRQVHAVSTGFGGSAGRPMPGMCSAR